MSAQTWRVVLASGEVREVVVRAGHSFTDGVGYFARLSPTDTMAFGADPRGAVLRLAVARYLDVAEILSPGEPSRAELVAQRDKALAEVAKLRAELSEFPVRRECPNCRGEGSVNRYRCGQCRGDGVIEVSRG